MEITPADGEAATSATSMIEQNCVIMRRLYRRLELRAKSTVRPIPSEIHSSAHVSPIRLRAKSIVRVRPTMVSSPPLALHEPAHVGDLISSATFRAAWLLLLPLLSTSTTLRRPVDIFQTERPSFSLPRSFRHPRGPQPTLIWLETFLDTRRRYQYIHLQGQPSNIKGDNIEGRTRKPTR